MSVKLIHVNSPNEVSQYNRVIKSKPTMVLFYMDGCGHCESMKPEWEKFEEDAKNTHINRAVARVNANYMSDLEGETDVMGYPTIMMLLNGKKHNEFTSKRTSKEFMNFLKDNLAMNGGRKIRRKRKSSKKSKKRVRKSNKRAKRSKRSKRTRRTRRTRRNRRVR